MNTNILEVDTMSNQIVVNVQCPVMASEAICNFIVREKYAACVGISSTKESRCWIAGALTPVLEDKITFVTDVDKLASLRYQLLKVHPYENPAVASNNCFRTVTASSAPILKQTYKTEGQVYRASGVIFLQDNKILLVRRGPTSPWMPGSWSLVTGGVDPGESPFQAAIRESKEEVGLTPLKMKLVGVGESPGEDIVHFFLCTKYTGDIVLNYENDRYEWVGIDTITTYNMPRLQAWFARQTVKAFNQA